MLHTTSAPPDSTDAYLTLLRDVLTGIQDADGWWIVQPTLGDRSLKAKAKNVLVAGVARTGYRLARPQRVDRTARENGEDWPLNALSMIGLKRMDQLRAAIETVLEEQIPGDIIETGVWRGGAMIYARAVLAAHDATDRTVWCADSFAGLPKPDDRDPGDTHWQQPLLAVSLEQVRAGFARFGLLDDQVRFLKGWFADTLPTAPIERLAILRLDGDMYASTMDALTALYDKVSPGGFVIVDDYGLDGCRKAITDFRAARGISDELVRIDPSAVYWRRT